MGAVPDDLATPQHENLWGCLADTGFGLDVVGHPPRLDDFDFVDRLLGILGEKSFGLVVRASADPATCAVLEDDRERLGEKTLEIFGVSKVFPYVSILTQRGPSSNSTLGLARMCHGGHDETIPRYDRGFGGWRSWVRFRLLSRQCVHLFG